MQQRNKQRYLAFGHEKRVGKDTAATLAMTYLKTTNKFPVIRKAGFADEVKRQCYKLFGWSGLQDGEFYEMPGNENLRETILPLLGCTPRQCWIGYANKVREFRDSVWRDFLFETNKSDFLIVKDMRFPFEADDIIARGGVIIKIEKPDVPHTSDAADDALLGYNKWHRTIINDGSLADFNKKIIAVINELCLTRGIL